MRGGRRKRELGRRKRGREGYEGWRRVGEGEARTHRRAAAEQCWVTFYLF